MSDLQVLEIGTELAIPEAPGAALGYHFITWRINGVEQRDVTGRALNPLPVFTVVEPTVATAVYVLTDQDQNINAIPDWWEYRFSSGLMTPPDMDGDGFSLAEEFDRDYHPNFANRVEDGGFSIYWSASSFVAPNPVFGRVEVRSEPPELFSPWQIVTNLGTTVRVGYAHLIAGEYRFAYWQLNSERVTDQLSRANPVIDVVMISNSVAEAVYVLEDEDGDADGIPDWWEWQQVGALDASGASDIDQDGFNLVTEFERDYHPHLSNEVVDGGFSLVASGPVLAIPNVQMGFCTISSDPPGLLSPETIVTNLGATISIGERYGSIEGFRLVYWLRDGLIQVDVLGRPLNAFHFSLQSNTAV
ncbi:MAG: hypothetical protein AAF492_20025, partial [Verrucomicrobiota bacterium]